MATVVLALAHSVAVDLILATSANQSLDGFNTAATTHLLIWAVSHLYLHDRADDRVMTLVGFDQDSVVLIHTSHHSTDVRIRLDVEHIFQQAFGLPYCVHANTGPGE